MPAPSTRNIVPLLPSIVLPATATFETGVNAATISAGDAGSETAWDAVNINGSGNTLTYDNAHIYDALSMKVVRAVSSFDVTAEWSTATLGTLTDWYGRLYLYCTANPASDFRIWKNDNHLFYIDSAGLVAFFDSGVTSTTTPIALNQWVRIEWHLIHSVTVGQIEIKLFNNPDSATPTETKTGTANHNNAASTTTMKFGSIGGASTGTYWLDNIVAGAASYPGPASVTALPLSYGRFTGPAQLTASPVTLYTCPTSRVARTLHIHASNPSSSAVDVTISVGADAAGTRIYGGFSVPADSVIRRYDEYSLAAGETIQAWASSAATVVLTVTGYDKAV